MTTNKNTQLKINMYCYYSAFHPAQGLQMSSNPCNYMDYGEEIIKRQTIAAYGCLVAGKRTWARA